jgi:hypothetical protein
MGKTIQLEGEPVIIDESTQVEDLKYMAEAAETDIATYMDGDEIVALGDRDNAYRQIPDGANVSFQPGDGTVFG